jgi:hypothetical protein
VIVVLTIEQPESTELIFSHSGSFKHGLNAQNRRDIQDWCIHQWGLPTRDSGWEIHYADGYIFVRTSDRSAGINAKMRWHGVLDD